MKAALSGNRMEASPIPTDQVGLTALAS